MPNVDIDSIGLQISADSSDAEQSLDRLSASLTDLNRSLGKIGANAGNIRSIAKSMAALNDIRIPDFSKAISQLSELSKIDLKNLENKTLKVDLHIEGISEAERMKYAIEDAVNNAHIDTQKISRQLKDTFNLDGSQRKEIQGILDDMVADFSQGGSAMREFEQLMQTLTTNGTVLKTTFDNMFHLPVDDLRQEYLEFLKYVRDNPIRSTEFSSGKGNNGAANQIKEDVFQGGFGKMISKTGERLDTGYFEELIHLFPTVMAGYRDIVNGEASAEKGATDMQTAMLEALKTAKQFTTETVSSADVQKTAGTASYKIYDNLLQSFGKYRDQALRESAMTIPLKFNVDEKRIETQISNAIKNISQKDWGKINLKLGVNTNDLKSQISKAIGGGDIQAATGMSNSMQDLLRSMREMATLNLKDSGIITFINTFTNRASKMKDTANAFPALALEIQEFFQTMQNVKIANNTVRMAEALAQIAKSGKNASAAMQNVSGSAAQTGKQFNYASVVGRGLNKVLDSIINALKKIGGGALSGIKALATNLSNIGRSSSGVSSLTSNIKTLIGTMIGFRGIVGVFNWSKQMMKMGADVTEIDHIVKSVFGEDMVGYVNDWANDTMEKFGIASTAAKQYAGTMSAMFQASNVSVKDSNQMATDLVGLAGDLSAFYNIDTETAYNKIKSGMAGMVRPLRDLGIDLSVATLKEYALAQGIDKSWTSMTQAEKVMLRYRYLMDQTGTQQGDFA